MRRLIVVVLAVVAAFVAWLLWPRSDTTPADGASAAPPASSAPSPRTIAVGPSLPPPPRSGFSPEDFPIIAPLNAPDSNIRGDLETLSKVFDAWRSNFPRDGNPVGENAEITAALTGANRLEFALIPKNHPAINAAGELCDRWGTPFRFHQLSGQHMEIQSAGPDRRFGTADDEVLTP